MGYLHEQYGGVLSMSINSLDHLICSNGEEMNNFSYKKMVLHHLRKIIAFEAACFTSVDPSTLLSTGAVTDERIESIHHPLFINEFNTTDFNHFAHLVNSSRKAAGLYEATSAQPEQSQRFRDVLYPAGFSDELRVVLIHQRKCWGFITLFRTSEQGVFEPTDVTLLSTLSQTIARRLCELTFSRNRRLSSQEMSCYHNKSELVEGIKTPLLEAGTLILSSNLDILSYDANGQQWLRLLRQWEHINERVLPRPIRAVCSALHTNHFSRGTHDKSKVSLTTSDGQFVTIQASKLNNSAIGQYVVHCSIAHPQHIQRLLCDAYLLSKREKQIVDQVLIGHSTKEIAATLHISTYTVQDHLKSIFNKLNIQSRRELMTLLLRRN